MTVLVQKFVAVSIFRYVRLKSTSDTGLDLVLLSISYQSQLLPWGLLVWRCNCGYIPWARFSSGAFFVRGLAVPVRGAVREAVRGAVRGAVREAVR